MTQANKPAPEIRWCLKCGDAMGLCADLDMTAEVGDVVNKKMITGVVAALAVQPEPDRWECPSCEHREPLDTPQTPEARLKELVAEHDVAKVACDQATNSKAKQALFTEWLVAGNKLAIFVEALQLAAAQVPEEAELTDAELDEVSNTIVWTEEERYRPIATAATKKRGDYESARTKRLVNAATVVSKYLDEMAPGKSARPGSWPSLVSMREELRAALESMEGNN